MRWWWLARRRFPSSPDVLSLLSHLVSLPLHPWYRRNRFLFIRPAYYATYCFRRDTSGPGVVPVQVEKRRRNKKYTSRFSLSPVRRVLKGCAKIIIITLCIGGLFRVRSLNSLLLRKSHGVPLRRNRDIFRREILSLMDSGPAGYFEVRLQWQMSRGEW